VYLLIFLFLVNKNVLKSMEDGWSEEVLLRQLKRRKDTI